MKAGVWTNVEPKLSETTLQVLNNMGFDEMTPVQNATLPLFLKNTDVVVEACVFCLMRNSNLCFFNLLFQLQLCPFSHFSGSYWIWKNFGLRCSDNREIKEKKIEEKSCWSDYYYTNQVEELKIQVKIFLICYEKAYLLLEC